MFEVIRTSDKTFQIVVHETTHNELMVLNYMVTLNGSPHYFYQLGILKQMFDARQDKDDIRIQLINKGFSFVGEMLLKGSFNHSSGLITNLNQGISSLDLSQLPSFS